LSEQVTFAWTSDRAQVNASGVDRRVPWRCVVRFRGARAPEIPQPIVTLTIDGTALASRTAGNDYQEIEATAPARPDPGLKVAIASSSTFVPGPSDPRPLGVQVDRVLCRPDVGHVMLPPRSVLGGAAAAAAVFGAGFALFGFSTAMALAATVLIALVQAWPLSMGLGPYTAYADRVVWMAWWIVAPTLAGVKVLEWSRRRPLTEAARIVAAFSAAVLYVKLLALLHPAKAIVDALFHAHRLEYVLSGRYFFQVAAGGVPFLRDRVYVFAAPWAALTHDHIALLRVVVTASEAVSGICLLGHRQDLGEPAGRCRGGCAAPSRACLVLGCEQCQSHQRLRPIGRPRRHGSRDRLAAGSRDWIQVIGLSALAALAFLSHVSTARAAGRHHDRDGIFLPVARWPRLDAAGRSVVLAVAIAAIASVALYYGRPEFLDAYRTAIRAASSPPAGGTTAASTPVPGQRLADGTVPTMAMSARIGSAVILAGDALGWPTVVLALWGGGASW
jgi:hypothetical protein